MEKSINSHSVESSLKKSETKPLVEEGTDFENIENLANLDFYTLSFLRSGHIDIPELTEFDPKWELKEIKRIVEEISPENQSAERVLLVDDFKRKFRAFRLNISRAQVELEEFLRQNPDTTEEVAKKKVIEIIKHFKIRSVTAQFNQVIGRFIKDRQVIAEIVEKAKSDAGNEWEKELFTTVFGFPPQGRVKVEVLPKNLYFKIWNIGDYALGRGGDLVYAKKSAGAHLRSLPHCPQLDGMVLIENNSNKNSPYFSVALKIHEEEHGIHEIFPTMTMVRKERRALFELTKKSGDVGVNELRTILKRMALEYRGQWEKAAKTEILAYLKEGRNISSRFFDLTGESIKENLLNNSEKSLYYYLVMWDSETNFSIDVSLHLRSEEFKDITLRNDHGGEMTNEELEDLIKRVINESWQEYREELKRNLKIAEDLSKKYSPSETLRILSQEPFNRWAQLGKIML